MTNNYAFSYLRLIEPYNGQGHAEGFQYTGTFDISYLLDKGCAQLVFYNYIDQIDPGMQRINPQSLKFLSRGVVTVEQLKQTAPGTQILRVQN